MKPILTPAQVREMEKQSGESEIQMVARAARALWSHIQRLNPRRVRFLCGPGNNGADGYAAACLARDAGVETDVVAVYPPRSEACRYYAEKIDTKGFNGKPDVWVDAVFGSGVRTDTNPIMEQLQAQIEASDGMVVAADVPSGLDALTGHAADWTIPADMTVVMGFWKPGLLLCDGMDMCGEVRLAELGFPVPETYPALLEPRDAAACYPVRKHNAHKNTHGHLLILAGSEGMTGAAAMCARSAIRGGAGLTTIVCPRGIIPILQILCPEAMCKAAEDVQNWEALLKGKTAVAAGPGYTGDSEPLRWILASGLPTVLDAGALNLLAEDSVMRQLLTNQHVITPHPGEARRLIRDLSHDPLQAAAQLHDLGCTVIYKGAASVIAGQRVYISRSGCPGMAKGGSGDALTGLLGALLAQGYLTEKAAYAADEIHGLAGELAQETYGDVSMTAMDLIEAIPAAICRVRASV